MLSSFAVDFTRRILPMLKATWVQVDVLLDARQTWTYYSHADPNGTYAKWSKDCTRETNSRYGHSVSEGYFLAAMTIWLITPILLAVFLWLREKESLVILNGFFHSRLEFECCDKYFLKTLLRILFIPIDILSAAVVIYVVIPYTSFKLSFKILMRHEFMDDDKLVNINSLYIDSKWLPGWNGFEFLGEACPQLILSIVFMANNYEYMLKTEAFIGTKEFEVALTSMIFSVGSISMGLYSGIPVIFSMFGK